ncbi:MAG: cysteine--tRNA ligase [Candidatus Veblenbacteria bacterium]|nr:cysteine--tRNA ligase [Candidatus Veblenbacteria bacterium]
MALSLYNTLTRKKEELTTLKPGEVGLYTCGPTVYAPPHIGNLRTYLFEDLLKRVLLMNAYQVNHVMNITDVGHLTSDADEGEDKMEKGSQREGKSVWEIAEFYTTMFKQNMAELNILEPNVWCKATDHITEQLALIQQLEAKGLTYKTSDGIYFDTAKLKDYGKLAKLDAKGLKEGARVEANPEKRNPTDFALWKFSPPAGEPEKKRQMEWDSPWGVGFPGWHIECSAMSMKYLGETFDIHCGGIDHIPVHHTNEIAQSEAATGKPFVKYWLHGEFLVVDAKRMGKSEGNLLTLDWLTKEGITPLAYRYFCLMTHYRKPLNFSLEAALSAQKALQNLQDKVATMGEPSVGCAEYEEKFKAALNDDLNAPQGLAIVWELMKSSYPNSAKKQSLLKMDEVLGLGLKDVPTLTMPPEVEALVEERERIRRDKDFAKADDIRIRIKELGFTVDDTELGPVVKKLH